MVWVRWSAAWRFCALGFFLVFNAVGLAQTHVETLTFDDLAAGTNSLPITNGYHELNWSCFRVANAASQPGTVYQRGMISSPNVGLAGDGGSYLSHWLGFKLHSAYVTGFGGLLMIGYYNGAYKFYGVYGPNDISPKFIDFDHSLVDQVSFINNATNSPFVFDNLTVEVPAVNYWTNQNDGVWQGAYWSFGVLPNSTQAVAVVDGPARTVTVDSSTQQFLPSMTVHDLLVDGPNTLVVDSGSGSAPFTVLQRFVVGAGGTLRLASGPMAVTGIKLDGGRLQAGNVNANLGYLTLASPFLLPGSTPEIDFIGTNTILTFTNFSTASGPTLVISNWGGLYSGGGPVQLHLPYVPDYQINEIVFRNPVGIPAGDYPAQYVINSDELVPNPINYWTNSVGGKWEDPFWMLGVIPNSTQTVAVVNTGVKTIEINAATVRNYPDSLTVGNLMAGGTNTVLVNSLSTNAQFTVTGALTVSDDATLSMTNSDVFAWMNLYGGNVFQNGGTVRGRIFLSGGNYYLSNGVLDGSVFMLQNCSFHQSGDNTVVSNLSFLGGDYELSSGRVVLGGLSLSGAEWTTTFAQRGGTNQLLGDLSLCGCSFEHSAYTLDNGLLCSSNTLLYPSSSFTQNGGVHLVSSNIVIDGGCRYYPPSPVYASSYTLNSGVLQARSMVILDCASSFSQGSGTTSLSESLELGGGADYIKTVSIGGGTFACKNVEQIQPSAYDIIQNGGSLIVSNLLSFDANYSGRYNNYGARLGQYRLNGGSLFASNIEIGAEILIGDSPGVSSITNPGYFQLSGSLHLASTTQKLGRLIVASEVVTVYDTNGQMTVTTSNALIDFTAATGSLSFANSSSQIWSNGVTLTVSNWNGSFAGGGKNQLRFGNSASGLSGAQLKQIVFVNPVGIRAGQYPARILSSGEVVPSTSPVNYWIKGVTGAWQETNSWSLHALPSASQSIFITGSWLNVHIDPDTKWNYPQTLTVGDVTVGGSATTFMLNWISQNVPFHALNGLTVAGESPTNRNSFLVLQSGAYVDSGGLHVTNGNVCMDGGFLHVTNADTWLNNGEFYITNGLFDVGTLWLGSSPSNAPYGHGTGSFFQYGGTVTASNIHDGSVGPSNVYNIYGGQLNAGSIGIGNITAASFNQYGGRVATGGISMSSQSVDDDRYNLFGGELDVNGALNISSYYANDVFFQGGGTNRSADLSLRTIVLGGSASYVLNAGLLSTSNVFVGFNAKIDQSGGRHMASGTLTLQGQADRYGTDFASYFLTDSYLAARNLQLQCGWLTIGNSTVLISNTLYLNLAAEDSRFSELYLSGTLSCSNAISGGAGSDIAQSGGSFAVSNLFQFGGNRNWYGYNYPTYTFSGGTLSARNIEMDGEFTIGNSASSGRITNTGYFQHSGILDVGDATEHLGRFILGPPIVRTQSGVAIGTNAVINFIGNNTVLAFADSSHEVWSSSNVLDVSSWHGSINGGGSHQLKFGTNALGLTSGQLSRVHFVNPSGFPAGSYGAKILSTGEVVPYAPVVLAKESGSGLVIAWTDGSYFLQSATNVLGPWTNVVGAMSPYTNSFASGAVGFFRLVR